jgi:hypothetical protein
MTTRVRGFAEWTPRAASRQLLDQVRSVLDEYAEYLPMTVRQIFYRLVGSTGYDKTELAYDRLGELLNRARRAGQVDFDAIRDGGVTSIRPLAFTSRQHFIDTARRLAANYKMDRQTGQPAYLELWVEASGMAPMLAAAIDEYGVPVYSCGGFDSLTAKHEAAQRIAARDVPTVVLHVGDFDPSGVALFEAAAEDVAALAEGLGGSVSFHRVAVTPEQITRYSLPTAPAKSHDKRSAWMDGDQTVQAEAMPPDTLITEVRQAVTSRVDFDALAQIREQEVAEGDRVAADIEALLDDDGDAS